MVHGISFRSSNSSVVDNNFLTKMNDVRGLKHNLTLDLHLDSSKSKKNKFNHSLHEQLSTPDYQNLDSYAVEKLLSESSGIDFKTPTPTTIRSLLFSNKDINMYNDDSFPISVLNNLNNESSQNTNTNVLLKGSSNCNSNSNLTMDDYDYENLYPTTVTSSNCLDEASPLTVRIKDEPQTVPNVIISPSVSPVNMDNQERLKADRKKARNRLAAAKCRKKKLEKIACLESRVRELKEENSELGQKQATLKKEVISLKERIVRHCENGCSITPLSSVVPFY